MFNFFLIGGGKKTFSILIVPFLHCLFKFLVEASSEVVKKNSRIPESASYVRDVPKPDVIVIEDDQKKRMEGFHRLDTGEGKQASSMLRMLASGGNGKFHSNYFGCVLPPLFTVDN